jgi:hypothetical protein
LTIILPPIISKSNLKNVSRPKPYKARASRLLCHSRAEPALSEAEWAGTIINNRLTALPFSTVAFSWQSWYFAE